VANIQDIYPLAPLQEGILFHHLLAANSDAYVVSTLLEIDGPDNLAAFVRALQWAVNRHDVLRTAILYRGVSEPIQVVVRQVAVAVETLQTANGGDPVAQLIQLMHPGGQNFDITRAPLLRLKVAAAGRRRFVLLQMHHIVCDAHSLGILIAEVMAYLRGSAHELPDPIQYREHVMRIRERARNSDDEAFFRKKLGDVNETTAPYGLLDTHGDGSSTLEESQTLQRTLSARLRDAARQQRVSPATLFHAAWALVVAETSGRSDVVFGTVLFGQLQARGSARRGIGMFLNSLPVRLRLESRAVRELVAQTQSELLDCLSHEQASLAVAIRCSGAGINSPLFTSLLNFRYAPSNPEVSWGNAISGTRVLATRVWTNYPILMSVDDQREDFAITAQVNRRVDPAWLLDSYSAALLSIVEELETPSGAAALALATISPEMRLQVLRRGTGAQIAASRISLVHELFEEQAQRSPNETALSYRDRALSYEELNQRATQAASILAQQGVGAGDLVGICVERGPDLVVGLVAILKAGAAYVPLDPGYPADRLSYMVENARLKLLLSQESLSNCLPATDIPVLMLPQLVATATNSQVKHESAASELSPDHPVYLIYTSGSTGKPKGVAMPHRAMVNLIEWHRSTLTSARRRRVLQFAALSFDVAFQEIFTTVCTGGTLVLLDGFIRKDIGALTSLLTKSRIDTLFIPPLMLQAIADYSGATGAVPECLTDIITAGEQLRIDANCRRFFGRLPECRLHNHYGPTETHVVTALTLSGSPDEWPAVPAIGRPLSNVRIYILDAMLNPVSPGVVGEIYVGGTAVATGYAGNPEMTSQRFLADPFCESNQMRMYRTGDLGRWRTDGSIDYLGRNDSQIKMRGFRVELEEIEVQLLGHPLVKEAAVLVRENAFSDKLLVAYVSLKSSSGGETVTEELRSYMKAVLPDYMVPAAFVLLDRLPLTPNGKLDKHALPNPDHTPYRAQSGEAPQGDLENVLAGLWRSVLQVETVYRDDNFFGLGGHSLSGMKLILLVAKSLGIRPPVMTIFQCPTIREMAISISRLLPAESGLQPQSPSEIEEGFI
jgi:amino acid adenylation domain-containing protein